LGIAYQFHEAKVMLEKAVFAVKADKAKALGMFNKGEGGFMDRDLYPFCFNIGNGIVTAGPSAVLGKDVRTLKDPTGKAFGEDFRARWSLAIILEASLAVGDERAEPRG
jgi:hypothetical protein